MDQQRFAADQVLTADGWQSDFALLIRDGIIVSLGARAELELQAPDADVLDFGRLAILPGTVNAHNHSFQSLLRGRTEDRSFFDWRDVLYRFGGQMGPEQIEAGALLAYGEMLLRGATTVVDFFYLHGGSNQGARAAMQAARRLGIRLVLARSMIDFSSPPPAYRETIGQACDNLRELAAEVETDPLMSVIPAPHSPHGASAEMIQAGALLAEELDTPWHIHVAEGRYEVERIREEHGRPPLAWIDSLGALSDRTCIVHGVWLDRAEIDLLGARGGKLIYCPSSNMFLGDGITPLPRYLQAGVTVSLGSDGGCGNNRVSVFEEMRMAALLQSASTLDPTVLTTQQAFGMGTRNGAAVTRLPVGELAVGRLADFVVIDPSDLSLQPAPDLLANVVYSMDSEAIRAVYVSGHPVARDRSLVRVARSEIVERLTDVTNWMNCLDGA